jgi:uncharacterized surface protein with fasciclin (FAS1) repeats
MTRFKTQFFSLCILLGMISCEKGNLYYENYKNDIKTFNGNSYEYLEENKGVFDSLLLVLDRIFPLQDTLRNKEVTFFAPTNQSFTLALQNLNTQRRLANKKPLYLEDIARHELDSLMSKYIIAEHITTDSIRYMKDGVYKDAVNHNYRMHVKFNVLNASGYVGGGQHQIIFTDPNNSIFERYWEKTTTNSVNIFTSNGVIHILSPAHNFGFGKLGQYTN